MGDNFIQYLYDRIQNLSILYKIMLWEVGLAVSFVIWEECGTWVPLYILLIFTGIIILEGIVKYLVKDCLHWRENRNHPPLGVLEEFTKAVKKNMK